MFYKIEQSKDIPETINPAFHLIQTIFMINRSRDGQNGASEKNIIKNIINTDSTKLSNVFVIQRYKTLLKTRKHEGSFSSNGNSVYVKEHKASI